MKLAVLTAVDAPYITSAMQRTFKWRKFRLLNKMLRCDLHPYPSAHSKSTQNVFPFVPTPPRIPVYISLLLVL